MIKVKTKSGFVIDVDENKAKDWRFTEALADWQSDETAIVGLTVCLKFLLGDKGKKALMEHVTDKNDYIPTERMIEEFKEILELLGDEVKKSESSQA